MKKRKGRERERTIGRKRETTKSAERGRIENG